MVTLGAELRRVAALVSALILVAPAYLVEAQQAQVTIRAESGGMSVPGAEVAAGTLSAATGATGEALLMLDPGMRRIRVTALGYAEREVDVEVAAGADTTVVVELGVEAVEADEILVLSTRTERRIGDVPMRVEVVARE